MLSNVLGRVTRYLQVCSVVYCCSCRPPLCVVATPAPWPAAWRMPSSASASMSLRTGQWQRALQILALPTESALTPHESCGRGASDAALKGACSDVCIVQPLCGCTSESCTRLHAGSHRYSPTRSECHKYTIYSSKVTLELVTGAHRFPPSFEFCEQHGSPVSPSASSVVHSQQPASPPPIINTFQDNP